MKHVYNVPELNSLQEQIDRRCETVWELRQHKRNIMNRIDEIMVEVAQLRAQKKQLMTREQ